jgi:acetyltransferase
MTEREAKLLLAQYKIPVTREKLAGNVDEAKIISKYLGFPVALKIESPDILHKTEVEGVRLNIHSEKELKIAFNEILSKVKLDLPNAEVRGILVQEMISRGGIEAIVGVSRDPQWGPTIMFGLGGILTEVLEDVSFRICPITESDAWEMIQEIKGYKLLQGFRGRPKADLEAVVDILLKLSQLTTDFETRITEVDINPLVIFPEGEGCIVIDSSVILG